MYLAMVGVEHLSINDPQELDNLNRFPMGTIHDLGMTKTLILKRFMRNRPHLQFKAIKEPAESPALRPFFRTADCILCCSNTISSRRACVNGAVQYRKFLVDVSVRDGRLGLGGCVRLYRPDSRLPGACPMCFLGSTASVVRGEGLLATAVCVTAALAAHIITLEILGMNMHEQNGIEIDLWQPRIEALFVRRKTGCRCCSA